MKLEFWGQIFERPSNFKFYENPCSGRRDTARKPTAIRKLKVAFRNSANVAKQD
jgi:hypothetical protein